MLPSHTMRNLLIIIATFVLTLCINSTVYAASVDGQTVVSAVVPETPALRLGLAANSTVEAPIGVILGEAIPISVTVRSLAGNPRTNHELEFTLVDQWGRVIDRTQARTDQFGQVVAQLHPAFAGRYRVVVRDLTVADPAGNTWKVNCPHTFQVKECRVKTSDSLSEPVELKEQPLVIVTDLRHQSDVEDTKHNDQSLMLPGLDTSIATADTSTSNLSIAIPENVVHLLPSQYSASQPSPG